MGKRSRAGWEIFPFHFLKKKNLRSEDSINTFEEVLQIADLVRAALPSEWFYEELTVLKDPSGWYHGVLTIKGYDR